MKYNYTMIIGRFQPFHNAHKQLLDHALSLGEKVIVVLGSSHSSPTIKNPFTAKEREAIIMACYDNDTQSRLIFAPIRDYPYNENQWIAEVQNIVNETLEDTDNTMGLVGYFKDESSYYLNLFPQWKLERFTGHTTKNLHATNIRDAYFKLPPYKLQGTEFEKDLIEKVALWSEIQPLVPKAVYDFLLN